VVNTKNSFSTLAHIAGYYMMIQKISIETFIPLIADTCLLDVRSPVEYKHAHIPGAINLPLFNDEERKIVGTTYKQQSREAAIKTGLDFFGPKMKAMVEEVEQLIAQKSITENKKTTLLVHCARGGMRSAAVAWLLSLYGFEVISLNAGYKAYRNWVLKQFEKSYTFKILSGNTGSKKTTLLQQIALKQNVIDLEALASHKGSAFGSIGMPPQPSQEMFENLLAMALFQKAKNEMPVWLEDESQRIGKAMIPNGIWKQMREANVYFLDYPFENRLKHILDEYGNLPVTDLKESILKIAKRLGGLETKTALQFLEDGDVQNCFSILLHYYDKQYRKGLEKRENLKDKMFLTTVEEIMH
jgi:tRNA 2-selenouridine synthase